MKSKLHILFALFVLLGMAVQAQAQTMRLRQQGSNSNRISVRVGQTLTIEVFADLQGVQAAGISIFVSVPDGAFQVVDQGLPGQVGIQPFIPGSLFSGATPGPNLVLPETDSVAGSIPGQQLEYSLILGQGANRARTGAGVVATFQLVCVKPIDNGEIVVDDNAVRETRLVLTDGISERRFTTVQGMAITVTGLELLDIPDVILLPGQADSTQIGRLTDYVQNSLVPVDSLRWSFEPASLDSIAITIDPLTKLVKIVPAPGWSGRQRIIWKASEPSARVVGEVPLSAQDASTIVVNNPPRFLVTRAADGAKRDTVRFREDDHPFLPEIEPSTRQAFRWKDLDTIVEDIDISDPQTELNFIVLGFGQGNNVRGQVSPQTHELLIWSRQDFSGVDSLRILVNDGVLRGLDTLRVIVEVSPINDAPAFQFVLEDRQPKIGRGGRKTYLLKEILEDVDTPLDSLEFSWINDPGGNFFVDTTRTAAGLEISVRGATDFVGTGRVTFIAEDPANRELLRDTMVLFFTAADALPPTLREKEIKIELSPGGPPQIELLDGFVDDPDNSPSELTWVIPPLHQSNISIDERRRLSVSAPVRFIGYEETILTVTDPSNQGDNLKLRIYSSNGDPVTGGLPDLVLDRGETHRTIDLDGYYHDSNNADEEMLWERLPTFDENNLQVSVDPVTHLVTFFAQTTAAFKTEIVVFRVTDPAGTSANDTMLVTIRSGGGGQVGGFTISALPTDLVIQVDKPPVKVFDLDDFVKVSAQVSKESISWTVTGSKNTFPKIDEQTHEVSVFGFQRGIDSLTFTGRDTLGGQQSASAIVRVVGESELLKLHSISDIQFIAGQPFTLPGLNQFVVDRQNHPDSLLSWSVQDIKGSQNIIPRVSGDTLFVVSFDVDETDVVLTVRNVKAGVAGRDTIKVFALDRSLADRPLKSFPPIVFQAGKKDSSVVLNEFLPDEFLTAGQSPAVTNWSVSGQRKVLPVIDRNTPHRLRLEAVGNSIGTDTLSFRVELGNGFSASGKMEVTVTEPVDATTLDLQVVPNPVNPNFMDIFVIARRQLAGTPNVIRNFETRDSTVAVRQIEDDLTSRGVLIWAGNIRVRSGGSGEVRFTAQALTALGTDVSDTATVALATILAGKRAVLDQGAVHLEVPADALEAGTTVLLKSAEEPRGAAKRSSPDELRLLRRVEIYPAGLSLRRPGVLEVEGLDSRDALYRSGDEGWEYAGGEGAMRIERLGLYGVLRDEVAPRLHLLEIPGEEGGALRAEVADGGSGLGQVRLALDGHPVQSQLAEDQVHWTVPADLGEGEHWLELVVRDRAGNQTERRIDFARRPVLPQGVELGVNFPNPFNPETTIPFALPAGGGVRLLIFNVSGQLVRQLLVDVQSGPGRHRALWDGRDDGGAQVGSGIYLYRLETQEAVLTRRMTLLK